MGSELREVFNYHLLNLMEHGILKRTYSRRPDACRNDEFCIAEAATLGFENLLFPISWLTMGMTAAVMLTAFEAMQTKMAKSILDLWV